MNTSVVVGAATLLASVMLLTGCSGSTMPELHRPQTEVDLIPHPDANTDTDIDRSSTRFVGEVSGIKLYLARPTTDDGVCAVLVATPPASWYQSGCGEGDGLAFQLDNGVGVEIGNMRLDVEGQRTQLSESVTVVSEP
ncbi:hypothetical protein ACPW96_23040 [Micromonospora sp. DT81.3]|uniref:hypothetical protein n=1 Tax=Micromonospora sp. DT81.3 TaxID=3416523 RepID=UPI003CF2995F